MIKDVRIFSENTIQVIFDNEEWVVKKGQDWYTKRFHYYDIERTLDWTVRIYDKSKFYQDLLKNLQQAVFFKVLDNSQASTKAGKVLK